MKYSEKLWLSFVILGIFLFSGINCGMNSAVQGTVYFNHGLVKVNTHQYEEAVVAFNKAIQLNPDYAAAYHNRGVVKSMLGEHASAISDFDNAIRIKPDFAVVYNKRGYAKSALGQYASAIIDFDKTIQLKPNDAVAYNNRGYAKSELGHYASAIADYDVAIQLKSDEAFTYNNRGLAKVKLGQLDAAIIDFNAAIRIKPDYIQAYCHRATVNIALKEPENAISDFDKAIQLDSDYTEAYTGRRLAKISVSEHNSIVAKSDVYSSPQTPQQVAKKALGSTVLLVMKDTNGETHGLGSGFFVSSGQIATNLHVVRGALKGYAKLVSQNIKYNIDGVAAIDEDRDLVILQVTAFGIPSLPLGNSDAIEIGESVYAAGNPKGLEGTFSDGIISSIRGDGAYKILQMTAPISQGSSGGPVLNKKGEVIGISVLTIRDGQNLNFAIPINYLKFLLAKVQRTKSLQELGASKKNQSKFFHSDDSKNSGDLSSRGKLTWSETASYTFSLRNSGRNLVENVSCIVIFYDMDGNQIDSDVLEFAGQIAALESKMIVRRSIFDIPYCVGINMKDYSIIGPRTKRLSNSYEVRVIDFEIVK